MLILGTRATGQAASRTRRSARKKGRNRPSPRRRSPRTAGTCREAVDGRRFAVEPGRPTMPLGKRNESFSAGARTPKILARNRHSLRAVSEWGANSEVCALRHWQEWGASRDYEKECPFGSCGRRRAIGFVVGHRMRNRGISCAGPRARLGREPSVARRFRRGVRFRDGGRFGGRDARRCLHLRDPMWACSTMRMQRDRHVRFGRDRQQSLRPCRHGARGAILSWNTRMHERPRVCKWCLPRPMRDDRSCMHGSPRRHLRTVPKVRNRRRPHDPVHGVRRHLRLRRRGLVWLQARRSARRRVRVPLEHERRRVPQGEERPTAERRVQRRRRVRSRTGLRPECWVFHLPTPLQSGGPDLVRWLRAVCDATGGGGRDLRLLSLIARRSPDASDAWTTWFRISQRSRRLSR
jgi:hypothetical protein